MKGLDIMIIINIEKQKKIKQYRRYNQNCLLMPRQMYSHAFWQVYNGKCHVAIGFNIYAD